MLLLATVFSNDIVIAHNIPMAYRISSNGYAVLLDHCTVYAVLANSETRYKQQDDYSQRFL